MFNNLKEVKLFAEHLIREHNLDDKVSFDFSLRLRNYGYYDDEKHIIVLNAKICLINLHNDAFIEYLILHEVVHALEHVRYKRKTDYHFHGKHFKEIANEIGCISGKYLDDYFKIKQAKKRINKDEIQSSIDGI